MLNICNGVPVDCEDKGTNYKAIQLHKYNPWCFYLSAKATEQNDTTMQLIGMLKTKCHTYFGIDDSKPAKGVALTYLHGETYDQAGATITRQTQVTLHCDHSATGPVQFKFIKEQEQADKLVFSFEATTQYACPKWSPK